MKVYIQSKSGNFNVESVVIDADSLMNAMKRLRGDGGYYTYKGEAE